MSLPKVVILMFYCQNTKTKTTKIPPKEQCSPKFDKNRPSKCDLHKTPPHELGGKKQYATEPSGI